MAIEILNWTTNDIQRIRKACNDMQHSGSVKQWTPKSSSTHYYHLTKDGGCLHLFKCNQNSQSEENQRDWKRRPSVPSIHQNLVELKQLYQKSSTCSCNQLKILITTKINHSDDSIVFEVGRLPFPLAPTSLLHLNLTTVSWPFPTPSSSHTPDYNKVIELCSMLPTITNVTVLG